MSKFADGRQHSRVRAVGRGRTVQGSDVYRVSKVEVGIFTRESHILDIQFGQGGVSPRAASQETVQDVDEP